MNAAVPSKNKKMIAFLTIGLSIIGLILGVISRKPLFDTFSLGAWLGFISFLLSLGAVEDEGNNFFAKIAFWVSFVAMCVAIFLSVTA